MNGYKTTTQTHCTSVYLDNGATIRHEESVYINEPFYVDVEKMADDNHMVFGWANVSVNADGEVPLDWEGDVIPPDVLEKAAYQYVLKYRTTGEMHQGEACGYMVESVMFTKQKMAALGIPDGVVPEGWWVGFYVPDDEIVAKIKNGQYKMFSIQGKMKKLKV